MTTRSSKAKGLGKGLGALLADNAPSGGQEEVEITLIDPNRSQARKTFDDASLQELSASIAQHGVVQPVILKPAENGRYLLIAGERRWRAARKAGLRTIPAVIKNVDSRELMELSLIENLQRQDLNPLEEAEGIKTLMDEHQLTQEQVSLRLGKSRPYIANTLRLLTLSGPVTDALRDGSISAGHARCMVPLDAATQERLCAVVVEQGLSVRQTEALAKNVAEKPSQSRQKRPVLPEILEVETMLREFLGTRVKLTGSPKRGRILIEYYSTDELEGILERLNLPEH